MNVNHIIYDRWMLASPCSGSSNIPRSSVPGSAHIRPTSWHWQERALFVVFLLAFPATVSAVPLTLGSGAIVGTDRMRPRSQDPNSQNNSPPSNGSINMNVWLPILVVTLMFIAFSFATCIRRYRAGDAATIANSSANANGNAARPRRRPHRTPSQMSTKSLPPYMKEPGDHELVLYRGPLETEDDQAPHHTISTLAEEDDEHPGMRRAAFGIALDRVESVDTMAVSSTTNLIRRVSESVTRPRELHHATMPHGHRRSADAHSSLGSAGSEAELLSGHQRRTSAGGHAEPRGETPSYTEVVSATSTISSNDPAPNNVFSNPAAPSSSAVSGGRSRFSFLRYNPFSSHNNASQSPPSTRSETPVSHMRSESALSRFSSRESHESHSRTPSRNHNLSSSHSRSGSNLFRTFHSHSPGLHAGSSTISLDSISAPLTHTVKRAEFHAPKGGLMTPEQIKLITSREALERFGVPYGADAIAAFSLSRERLAEMGPPPDFESVAGEHQEQPGGLGSNNATEEAAQQVDTSDPEAVPQRLTSVSPTSQPSSDPKDVRADSRASTDMTYATAPESGAEGHDSRAQAVQVYMSVADELDDPRTARPATPETARPSSLFQDHGSVASHH